MARQTTIRCNVCGKTFDQADRNQHFTMYARIGYGSKYDGDELMLDICTDCMDSLIDRCVISPLESDDTDGV